MSHDRLASVLPAGDPLAPLEMAPRSASKAPSATPPVPGGRRRWGNGPVIAASAAGLLGAIFICVYLLYAGDSASPSGETIAGNGRQADSPPRPAARSLVADAEAGQAVAPSPGAAPTVPSDDPDPVMGNLLADASPRPTNAREADEAMPVPQPETPAEPIASQDEQLASADSAPETMDTTDEAAEAAEKSPEADDSAAVAAGAASLERSYSILRGGPFGELTAATAQAQQDAADEQQRTAASGAPRVAELAETYVDAIREGAATLEAEETFQLVPGVTVEVVQSSSERIAVQVNGRTKTYAIDSLPLVLAQRLASFVLPADSPETAAAAAAYQALWPAATDQHREQAFRWWQRSTDETAGSDYSQLEPIVRAIFEMPAGR